MQFLQIHINEIFVKFITPDADDLEILTGTVEFGTKMKER